MKRHLYLSCIVLLLGVWFSSGTLAPYATTLNPKLLYFSEPGAYLLNSDHEHFHQVDLMVGGYPPKNWENSHYLRRVLYSLLARPFTATFGFLYGGVLFNALLTLFTFLIFARYLKDEYPEETQKWGLWLMATYPGIFYWVGLPYHHASIVPLCLFQFLALRKFWQKDPPTAKDTAKLFLFMGICGLAYDLLPIFGFAAIIAVLLRKKPKHLLAGLPLAVIPTVLVNLVLSFYVDTSNNNTKIFGTILKSYLNWSDAKAWLQDLSTLPKVFFFNFMDSNFWALPLTFLIVLFFSRRSFRKNLGVPETLLLFSLGCLFLFNNLAPRYEGWQMRGIWISRIYQPAFVFFLVFILKSLKNTPRQSSNGRLLRGVLCLCLATQGLNVFGGILGFGKWAGLSYFRFYQHTDDIYYQNNLKIFGRRPLGF